jgi:vancomycin resistance protein YoaR
LKQEQNKTSQNEGKSRKGLIFVIVLVGLLLASVVAYGGTYYFLNDNIVPQGVKVAGCEVGGLSFEETQAMLAEKLPQRITLTADDFSLEMSLSDLGIQPDLTAAAVQASSFGHGWNLPKAFLERKEAEAGKFDIPVSFIIDEQKWQEAVANLKLELEKPPVSAQLNIDSSGKLAIIKEITGKKLLDEKLFMQIEEAFACGNNQIVLPVVEDIPELTAEKIETWGLDNELGAFSTRYATSSSARKHNISNASARISGTLLQPGETFSFNSSVGRRTVAEGFREAPVFKDGKLDKGIGGGICQASSTLYNAALLSGMEIVERSNHSMLVSYVAPGRDATVDYGSIDLKFKNIYDKPVYVLMVADGSNLRAAIFGAGDGRTFKVVSQTLSTIAYKEIIKTVSSPDQMGDNQKGGSGAVATTTRIVYRDGVEIAREDLGISRYAPMHRIKYELAGSASGSTNSSTSSPSQTPAEPVIPGEPVADPVIDNPV